MLAVGSLFSGIGGFDLGLERAGMRIAWQSEIASTASAVLRKHWPGVPNHGDIRSIRGDAVEPVDVLCGGFPCTDISSANVRRRTGLDGPQSGLWREYARFVGESRPRWVVIENSPRWRAWVPIVRRDLHGHGYSSLPIRVCAADVGAPHDRPRIFIVAHADQDSESLRAVYAQVAELCTVSAFGGHWSIPPPGGFRLDDGISGGMGALACYGNALIPQIAEAIGRAIVRAT